MKRKIPQIYSTEDPYPTHSSFPSAVRSSKTRLNTGLTQSKIAGAENENNLTETTSFTSERNRQSQAKTTEYAFFKKLKENAAAVSHGSRFHQNDQNQSSKFKSSDYYSSSIENKDKDFKSSLVHKNITPPSDNFAPVFSPIVNYAPKKSVVAKRGADLWSLADVHSMHNEIIEENGSKFKNANIFSKKRQKLRQLAENISFPEADELCSKGYDFVSVLLSKLFPDDNEDKSFELLKTGKFETNTKSSPLESEMRFMKSHWMPTSNFMELEYGKSLDVGFPSRWSEIPTDKELPISGSPSHHYHGTYVDDRTMGIHYELGERSVPIVWTGGDSACDLHTKNLDFFTSGYVKELTKFNHLIEPSHRREPETLLLGWDYYNMTDKSNLPMHCENAEQSLLPFGSNSHGNIQIQNLDDSLRSSEFAMPSSFPCHAPNLPSLQFSPSSSNKSHTFGERFLEVKNDLLSFVNDFTLSLPHTVNHLNQSEFSYGDDTIKGSSLLLSPHPQNHLWFMRKVLNEEHYCPGIEACFPTGVVDFDLEPKSLQTSGSSRDHYSHTFNTLALPQEEGMSSSFLIGDKFENYLDGFTNREIIKQSCEDIVNIHDWSSIYFQISGDKERTCPLLYGRAGYRDEYEAEIYSDDTGLKF